MTARVLSSRELDAWRKLVKDYTGWDVDHPPRDPSSVSESLAAAVIDLLDNLSVAQTSVGELRDELQAAKDLLAVACHEGACSLAFMQHTRTGVQWTCTCAVGAPLREAQAEVVRLREALASVCCPCAYCQAKSGLAKAGGA